MIAEKEDEIIRQLQIMNLFIGIIANNTTCVLPKTMDDMAKKTKEALLDLIDKVGQIKKS